MFKVNSRLKGTKEVARLIKSGADVNVKINDGYTALIYAKEWGTTDVIELLKAAGAEE